MATKAHLNPRTTHYEFLGPLGALFITLSVPATTYALFYGCPEGPAACPPPLDTLWPRVSAAVQDCAWWVSLWDPEAAVLYGAWYLFCVVAWFILPGDWIEGTLMRDGTRKKYKINGACEPLRPLWVLTAARDTQPSQRSCSRWASLLASSGSSVHDP